MEETHPQCDAVVYRRDTYRHTGRVKGGFELNYTRSRCKRRANGSDGLCSQHARYANNERWTQMWARGSSGAVETHETLFFERQQEGK